MLFNSYEFIFGFLPVTLLVYFLLTKQNQTAAALWLGLASLFFYGWWNPKDVPLLVSSVAINFIVGRAISRAHDAGRHEGAKWLMIAGLVFNLALLVLYKYVIQLSLYNYALSLVSSQDNFIGHGIRMSLPLGISFFTLTQIAFLIDTHRKVAREYSPTHYLLFVTYFPHLIAGPILHHKEIMPQFADPNTYRWKWENAAVGLTIFAMGLAKKVLIADEIGIYVSPVFDSGMPVSFFQAWSGALAYTLQLYFDFSGYTDMAIGLSRLFGIKLPMNFNSPYKAKNIVEFWRRWHMTLSRFLRDYLYFSLGGNRLGSTRRYANLMTTMILGGLWHGAGWTFVMWGTLHGLYLVINHAWRELVAIPRGWGNQKAYCFAAWLLTFLSVVVAWVIFRSNDLDTAYRILAGMAGANGFGMPAGWFNTWVVFATLHLHQFYYTFGLLLLAWIAPNTQQLLGRFDPATGFDPTSLSSIRILWRPSPMWFTFIAVLMTWSIVLLPRGTRVSEFLYFHF